MLMLVLSWDGLFSASPGGTRPGRCEQGPGPESLQERGLRREKIKRLLIYLCFRDTEKEIG